MTLVLEPTHADRDATGRFGRLIAHGTFYSAGTLLSNVSVILPFICAGQGMAWLAPLLYPAYCIGTATGNSLAPYLLDHLRRQQHLVVAGAVLAMSTLVAVTAAVSVIGGKVAVALLLTSVAMGMASGISHIAFTDIASTALSDQRRGELLLGQGASGSVLATAVSLLIIPMLTQDAFQRSVDLLFFGAAGLAVAGVAALFIRPAQSGPVPSRRALGETLRTGMRVARTQPWFRRYVPTGLRAGGTRQHLLQPAGGPGP